MRNKEMMRELATERGRNKTMYKEIDKEKRRF
jgi:hypothetical protein